MFPPSTVQSQHSPKKEKLSFEAFLAWLDEDVRAEWVRGEVMMMSPASMRHQEISMFLIKVMGIFVEHHQLGRVLGAPFVVRLPPGETAREPDILFVGKEREKLLRSTYLDGPADLIVEIISPESIGRDRGEKFVEYEQAGVSEFWLIDPLREQAEFYRLGDDNRYHPTPLDEHGVYHSKVLPGFWLRVAWLWQSPPPNTLDVLRDLGVL